MGRRLRRGLDDNTVKLWDVTSGKCLQTLEGHSNYVNSVSFSPDGTKVASGSRDKTVKLWDVTSGECLQTLEGHSSRCVQCVVFSSGECLQTLERHSSQVYSVSFSPDGTKVASGSGI